MADFSHDEYESSQLTVKGGSKIGQLATEMVGGETYQYYALGDHIVRAIGVCGERQNLKYMRIEVMGMLERLAARRTIEQLVNGYRGRVSHDAIIEAIMLVSNHFSQTLPELEVA